MTDEDNSCADQERSSFAAPDVDSIESAGAAAAEEAQVADEIVEVYCARDEFDAFLLRTLLEQSGIECRVVGELIRRIAGEVPFGLPASPRLWVRRHQAAAAREIIERREAGDDGATTPAWVCPRCDAAVDAGFDLCWRCLFEPNAD